MKLFVLAGSRVSRQAAAEFGDRAEVVRVSPGKEMAALYRDFGIYQLPALEDGTTGLAMIKEVLRESRL